MKTRIYQIIPELDIHHIKFMGFADMRQHYGGIVPAEIYGCVYDGTLQTQDLEEIFKLFNTERPTGICTKYQNEFDGEPDIPITEDIQVKFLPFRYTWD
ncbi:hypothetical protein CE91St36_15840 [Christensenellaceae bacterium]|nr:hypothetical protein CE91St36_15840 [Christensenellaceae bacterium]BDF61435.1 hypothetical protein CE91St37_15850 [Christensenellaceae bacterium]